MRPMRAMASRPSSGRLPCAARPCATISTQANPLWPTASCKSVGSVTMAMSARHSRTSASAPMLRYSSSTTAATTSRPRVQDWASTAGGRNHRRDPALHVLCAATVETAVVDRRLERIGHALDADGIDVTAEHDGRPSRLPVQHADDVRPARGRFLDGDVEAGVPHAVAHDLGDRGFAGRARDELRVH